MITSVKNSENLCPSGRHVMDPSWPSCVYCEGEQKSQQQTAYQEPIIASSDGRKTTVGSSISGDGNRVTATRVMPQNSNQPAYGSGGRGDSRKIRGIIITYSWHPQGDLFPIREGKNYIGAATVTRELGDPPCDILITEDTKLSSAHALILCRQDNFQIVDLDSTNGTFIDEKMIPIAGEELADITNIRTGTTVWTFMKIPSNNQFQSTKNPIPDTDHKAPQPDDTVIPR
jgi:hypothetical protein